MCGLRLGFTVQDLVFESLGLLGLRFRALGSEGRGFCSFVDEAKGTFPSFIDRF